MSISGPEARATSWRFKDTDLFEQIFEHILEECYRFKLVDHSEIFVDSTHVKARANNKKMQKRIAKQEARAYDEMLRNEIDADREAQRKAHPLSSLLWMCFVYSLRGQSLCVRTDTKGLSPFDTL